MIGLTDNAVAHLRVLLAEREGSGLGLRLMVEKGGCAGLQYAMKVDAGAAGDEVSERDGVRVFVDPASAPYLKGCTVDYVDTLADTGFKIRNPNAARSCGCGTSFEPAEAAPVPAALPEGEPCLSGDS